jgi:hypothetical protein
LLVVEISALFCCLLFHSQVIEFSLLVRVIRFDSIRTVGLTLASPLDHKLLYSNVLRSLEQK